MGTHDRMQFAASLLTVSLLFVMAVPAVGMAAPVGLGATSSFALLGGSTVTNTGSSVISGTAGGDVGVSAGSAITGFPPGTLTGTMHANDASATAAQLDLITAYNDAYGRSLTAPLVPVDLGGLTLGPGVYSSGGALSITGTLTLDAGGDPDAVFVFKSASTLVTASNSVVRLINGARYCRVFWPVASSATLGTGSHFAGHIFAWVSITANTSAEVEGQLLAHTGAVTLDSNTVANGICLAAPVPVIHITKTANPTALPSGPGSVTYTYVVTNPGTVPLSDVHVTDDRVSPVTYVSGDLNGNGLLDVGETWVYTATTTLSATTTNTATATGSYGGVPVTHTALVTVVVTRRTISGGQIPITATPWYNALLAGVALTLLGAVGVWRSTRKIHG